jgi:putative phage-type endonuclease
MLTAEQLEARRAGIGGSDVAAILGLSPWRTPLDVYLDKIGQGQPVAESGPMRWGSLLEPVIIDEFQRETGLYVDRDTPMLRHQEHAFMLANLDGVLAGDPTRIVECKTARSDANWGEPGTDQIPVYYQTQVAHYLAVSGAQIAYVPVLIGASDFRIYRVDRDESFIRDLIDAERAFWQHHVIARCPPDPVNGDDALKLWARDNGASLEVDDETAAKIVSLKALKAEAKELDDRLGALDDAVRIAFGEAATVTYGGQVLGTYKAQTAKRLDTKALRAAVPDIAAQYTTESTSRVLRLK